jgi:hypothetical protein
MRSCNTCIGFIEVIRRTIPHSCVHSLSQRQNEDSEIDSSDQDHESCHLDDQGTGGLHGHFHSADKWHQ